MTELKSVDEVIHEESPVWSVKNGPELDQEDQDTLNYAFENMVNANGMTIKQVIDQKNK